MIFSMTLDHHQQWCGPTIIIHYSHYYYYYYYYYYGCLTVAVDHTIEVGVTTVTK